MDDLRPITGDARGHPLGLRALFARSDDPYAGSDVVLARRLTLAMWVFGFVVVIVLELFFPPTAELGDYGWPAAGVSYLVAFAVVRVLADKRRSVGYDFLYRIMFLAVALIAATQYAAGGRHAPFHELYLVILIGVALMHPPRRLFAFLAVIAVALFAPVVYARSTGEPGEIATELVLWTGVALLMLVLMRAIRTQRVGLWREGADARLLARVDALTGLGNRRAFDEALDAELARSRRAGAPLSLIVADLDDFKDINDRFGHVLGDDCLRAATAALRGAVRRPDLCFRWGGDEFAILLTGADADVGAALALRLENAVADAARRPDGEPLTITCGHAELDPEMSAADAVARSDATLLTLKSRGRARAADLPPATPA